jgi:hypothetical protein
MAGHVRDVAGVIEFVPCTESSSATTAANDAVAVHHVPAADERRAAVLQLTVGSDKREASSQPKQLWSQKVIPAILDFYDRLRRTLPSSASAPVVLITHRDDGILPSAAALAILLAHFQPNVDLSSSLRNDMEGRGGRSKGDIRGYVAALSVHEPDASRISRRLMKELTAYFLIRST